MNHTFNLLFEEQACNFSELSTNKSFKRFRRHIKDFKTKILYLKKSMDSKKKWNFIYELKIFLWFIYFCYAMNKKNEFHSTYANLHNS